MRLEKKKSVHHLLVLCCWASLLRYIRLSLIGISWVQPLNFKNVSAAWRRSKTKSTWKERNQWIFKGRALSFQDFEALTFEIFA